MVVEVPIKKTQPVCRKTPPKNLGKIFFRIKERKKMLNEITKIPRKPLARELGTIGLGIFFFSYRLCCSHSRYVRSLSLGI
jgi:hypothetical protein